MLGVVHTGEGAVCFFSVFCQIVYSQEGTEIVVGFITLHVGISCNTAVTAVVDRLSLNRSVPEEYK